VIKGVSNEAEKRRGTSSTLVHRYLDWHIIVSGVDGVIFTLIFLVVTIFWKTTHTRSTILMDTQLIIAFLIGYLHALNIFLQ